MVEPDAKERDMKMNPWSDAELQELVKTEFAWNALVEPSQLSVSVDDGIATIFGTVDSLAEKYVAIEAAQSVYGIRDVLSEIEVKVPVGNVRTDGYLQEIVRQVLDWDALVPEDDVTATVKDGWVTLRGSTPTRRQRDEAERAVRHIVGVKGVSNLITLQKPVLTPTEIHTVVDKALQRRAEHAGNHIAVTVDGHRVTLKGEVDSPQAKRALLGAVGHAPGVETVCDELTIVATTALA